MTLEKAIEHGKEHRIRYAAVIVGTELGSEKVYCKQPCPECRAQKQIKNRMRQLSADEQIEEYQQESLPPVEDLDEWANRMAWGGLMGGIP